MNNHTLHGIDELEAEEDVGELANQCRLLRTHIAELESVVADLRQQRGEAWNEQERLCTRIAELKAERDRLRENLDHHTRKAHRSDAQHWCQYRIGLEACRDSVEALARSTDTECCNQPDQCWEPCGDLGKSEAHAKPADTEDE